MAEKYTTRQLTVCVQAKVRTKDDGPFSLKAHHHFIDTHCENLQQYIVVFMRNFMRSSNLLRFQVIGLLIISSYMAAHLKFMRVNNK